MASSTRRDGTGGVVVCTVASFNNVRCPSACCLLISSRVKDGFTRRGETGRVGRWHLIFYDIRCPSACFLLISSKVKDGFTRRGQTGRVEWWHLLRYTLFICLRLAGRRQSEVGLYYESSFICQSNFRPFHRRLITISCLK